MPEAAAKPVFLVDAFASPVLIKIDGRASFMNCSCLRDFFAEMIKQGKTKFVVDFRQCASMDSTFLGVLAGAALELRKLSPPGSLIVSRVGSRNLELLRNLGLHRLMTVDTGDAEPAADRAVGQALVCSVPRSELENARMVLEAHENLVNADASNQSKFQDVLAFLKTRVDQG
ncbi:MAG: STAS domain-containing protein [Opitutaceae bacterium]